MDKRVHENATVQELLNGQTPSREDLKKFLEWEISTLSEEEDGLSFEEALEVLLNDAHNIVGFTEGDPDLDEDPDPDSESIELEQKAVIIAVELWKSQN